LCLALALFIALLNVTDRFFFKQNNSFCLRFIHTCLPSREEFALPPPTQEELTQLDTILEQPFYYLAKGTHCFAFLSEDARYVIKFHRFASHMRPFPWLNHPFSYLFGRKRKEIKAYNLKRLHYHFTNYKQSFLNHKEETALLLVHLNRTKTLNRSVTLVDKTGISYEVSLDAVTFILQQKAELIYPTLDTLYAEERFDEAKALLSNIITLITKCCKKGYVDEDPILRKNYGLIDAQAIHIDIGDLIQRPGIEKKENYVPYVKELTAPLRLHLEKQCPELLAHYTQEIDAL
jgi:hypothetical protein